MSTPPAKRQKLDSAVDAFAPSTLVTIREISFQSPLRKKLNLIFTQSGLEAHSPAKQELSIPLKQIDHVICVVAPDKTTKTWNFVVIFKANTSSDPWVFGLPDTVAKTVVGGNSFHLGAAESYKSVFSTAFKQFFGQTVVEPSSLQFASPIPVPGRPNDTAFHVIAHRGAKEGFLYFLETGILYGFRKPVLFFPLATIREVTFTNILQRTFNLVVSIEDNVQGEEFGMIDQAVFSGIQGYTVKHGIQDASLSEQRKAKKVAKTNRETDEPGELVKAVKEYEEEYDEDAEHFRDFDKAEAEDGEVPKVKQHNKNAGRSNRVANESKLHELVEDQNTSDDEELDATFESGDDQGSESENSDEYSSDSGVEDDDDDDDEEEEEEEEDDDDEVST